MSLTDSISNTLTLIRNASRARHENVDIPSSGIAKAILDILKQNGYIENYRFSEDGKQGVLRVYLKYYSNKEAAIADLKMVSRPGLRIYAKKEKIPYVLRGRGIAIISTSQGMVTDKQARKLNIGGEVICYVW
ncbi:MAG: 30S ribosomal protein S8 [Candidatus Omnitrophica bacterium]|nr:30S ribosomal protein S8 [Candidatus Omnitrophota bacterium]MDD5352215.1 30S ribosomal protein S8 [Candidatus Omnitrophota bacterium]MDD5549813.1 30S ribosomal protein S8 [Candidatus Omnitrophota bacterium]